MNKANGGMSRFTAQPGFRWMLVVGGLLLVGVAGWHFWPPASTEDPSPSTNEQKSTTPLEAPMFKNITKEAGLDFNHTAGDLKRYYFPSIMGGGCALFDADRDGRLDVYFINGNERVGGINNPTAPKAKNEFYRQTEQGTFVNRTEESGLGDESYGMGVAVGDVNNDGYSDVYVTNVGPDRLYLNQRDGTFRDVTEASGIENTPWAASASFLDFDRDGWLDLYVTNYVDYSPERDCPSSNGQLDFCGPQVFFPVADKLFRNKTGEFPAAHSDDIPTVLFEDVSQSSGIASQASYGLGVVCADFNADRWPDIYVANDRMANFLWINQRDGTFVDEAVLRGAAFDLQGRPQASMGIALGDMNSDSQMDLYITHLEGETNAFYLSAPGGVFIESSAEAGLLAPSFPLTGFGTAFVDLDHNGFMEILVANGRVRRSHSPQMDLEPAWSQYAEKNQIFLNQGNGRFVQTGREDAFCKEAGVYRGLATGDIDNDGDMDLLVTAIAGGTALLRNDATKLGQWLAVRAVNPQFGGRDDLGALVTLIAGESRKTAIIQSGTSYLSASQPVAHFGLGKLEAYDRIDVIWSDGTSESFEGGPVAKVRVLERGTGMHIDGNPPQ